MYEFAHYRNFTPRAKTHLPAPIWLRGCQYDFTACLQIYIKVAIFVPLITSNNNYIFCNNMNSNQIIPFEDSELGTIWIEVSSESNTPMGGTQKVGSDQNGHKFDNALGTIRGIAGKLISQITTLPNRPDEVECKIGIKFNAEAGVVIAKASSEGSLELTLKWKNEKNPA